MHSRSPAASDQYQWGAAATHAKPTYSPQPATVEMATVSSGRFWDGVKVITLLS